MFANEQIGFLTELVTRRRVLAASALASLAIAGGLTNSKSSDAQSLDVPPAFLIAGWEPCAKDVTVEEGLGVNTFVGSVCDEQALAQAAAGSAYIINGYAYDKDSDSWGPSPLVPGEGAVLGPDEPDFNNISSSQVQAPPVGEPLLLNFTENIWPGSRSSFNYSPFLKLANIVTTDIYPVEHNCNSPGYTNVGTDYDVQLYLANQGKPNFQWLEANPVDNLCPSNILTPDEIQAEAWETLEAGATGLGWFFPQKGGPNGYLSFSVDPNIQATIKTIDQQALALSPMLLSPKLPITTPWGNGQSSGPGSNPIKVGGRLYNGSAYLLATNSTGNPIPKWQRQIPTMAPNQQVAVETTSGQVMEQLTTNKNGILPPVTFGPYQTEMLVWSPKTQPAIKKAIVAKKAQAISSKVTVSVKR